MKRVGFIILIFVVLGSNLSAQDEHKKKRSWIIPSHVIAQYAGGVGTYIIGAGYVLNKSQSLRLKFQYGFTPKFKTKKNLHSTSTFFSYLPANILIYKKISVMPQLRLGWSRAFADGPGTFTRLPSYFPDGYYAPNAFRFHFNMGANFKYDLKKGSMVKAMEFYIETTTNDLYVKYFFNYSKVHLNHIFTMALGINIMFK